MEKKIITAGLLLLPVLFMFLSCGGGQNQDLPEIVITYDEQTAQGSPYIFGGAQPRYLSEAQWDILKEQGFTFMRMQADLTSLVPCESAEEYLADSSGCADPANWNWTEGIYGSDFAQRAIDRGMAVCLVVKNGLWNRWPGTPEDEETIPYDFQVWEDIVRKIINHYGGGITYLECYNEVNFDTQFITLGSPYTRIEGYRKVVKTALRAVKTSDYPETPVGGPAAASDFGTVLTWLLSDEQIRENLGFVSFHAWGADPYPFHASEKYKDLLHRLEMNIPILRTSWIPDKDMTRPAPVARHLIASLNDGLEGAALWEIQPKESEDDTKYWFDGENTVITANTWILFSKTLSLGEGKSWIAKIDGVKRDEAAGAVNSAGQHTAVLALRDPGGYTLTVKSRTLGGKHQVRIFRGDAAGDGRTPIEEKTVRFRRGKGSFRLDVEKDGVYGILVL